ncbi:MAG TPA: peptide-methionine (R)-S-oxide reductase MsrB [Pyrinomonadaceae bacterium]|nr:peptide-methionine (R)-S-oxide reductase MsrB [Pyrinomonadaceae bacterium]
MHRRLFLSSSVAFGIAGLVAPSLRAFQKRSSSSHGGATPAAEKIERITKSDAEWKKILTAEQYEITRKKGTEAPYTSPLNDVHEVGVFQCVCCDLPLFDSATKFDSGTGWPSFYQPINKANVREAIDASLSEVRSEVLCARCDAHVRRWSQADWTALLYERRCSEVREVCVTYFASFASLWEASATPQNNSRKGAKLAKRVTPR